MSRHSLFLCLLFLLRATADGACRDCAQSGFGGAAENRFTAFDTITPRLFVNLSNLTLFVREADLTFPGFTLERSYNSDDTRSGPFGTGWTFNLGESLTPDSEGNLVLRRGSGRIDHFASTSSGGWMALTATTDTLAKNNDGTYTLRTPRSTVSRLFSGDGRLLAVQDSGAPRVTLDYDGAGLLTAAHYRGRKIDFSYDGNGRISSVTDSAGRTVSYSYTDDGRLAAAVISKDAAETYEYDGQGNLTALGGISVTYSGDAGYSAVASVATSDGVVRSYDTPVSPSQIRVTDGNGDATVYTSNASGLLASVRDANGNTTAYSYDAAGRRTSTVNGSGEATKFGYDSNGALTSVIDNAGNRWSADYNASGPVHITDPNGNVSAIGYDDSGNVVTVTDAAGGARAATRSATGQITSVADAAGNKTSWQYDTNGLPSGFTDALGGSWSYQYDGAARVSSRTDPTGTVMSGTYDAANRLLHVTAGDSTLDFDYSGNQLTYSYDAAGQVTALTMPGGKTVSYQYDHAHRLVKVSDWTGNFALYRYDAAGFPVSVSASGGPVTIYQYDAAHRLRAVMSTGPDGTPVAGYRYTLDANGNRTAVSALEPGTAPAAAPNYQYGFDAAGHPVSRSDGENYQYDARGNLIGIQGGRNIAFEYDPFGRLIGLSGDVTTAYGYDAAGLRTSRSDRHFVLQGRRVVMETDGSGAPVAWYVYGLGLLWKVNADGTTYFYHFDGDGNIVAVSNPNSGVVNRYRYGPNGVLVSSSETVENPFRARGEAGWMDDGNGLLFDGTAFRLPDLHLTLPAAIDLSPPPPRLEPPVTPVTPLARSAQ
jgi:YD repeat-containing protein